MAPVPSRQSSPATVNPKREVLNRLRDLKKEYDKLDITEEKLLAMLARVRREEGYLIQALNDELFTGTPEKVTPKTTAPSLTVTNQKESESKAPHLEEEVTRKQPPAVDDLAQTQTATSLAQDTPVQPEAAEMAAVASQPLQRQKRRRVAQSPSQLKVNRQRRQEQILARQRLEDALFAEDDDSSSSSSS
eukprot:CAMPEP_0116155458 /NCGR_PEP_ID=MMETSP0329-20121206/22320_1 /TAXON_ID=697910 /ORGANISM="Pseudo-nitzschia arenysensis, Strain B593" /LENGTH=189 /DNA_ID=CAMNT_0003652497 /DNA_START=773 /DNA_END=1342 /DNA_ORIENTATION=+